MSRHDGVLPRARWSRRLGLAALSAAVVFVAQVAAGLSVGFTGPVSAQAAQGQSGHPNRFDPRASAKSVNHLPAPPATPGPKPTYSPPHAPTVPMQPALVPLDPVAGAHFIGSDGVLELSVPAGAVTAADVKAAGGSMSLLVRQVMPASGSNAGGWGRYSFGTWLVQVVDAGGRPAPQGLRKGPGVKLHHDRRASALNLAHVRVLVNAPLPSWVDLNPASTPVKPTTPASGARQLAPSSGGGSSPSAKPALGPASRQTATLDPSALTLLAVVPMSSPSTAVSFNTDAPVATFGRPDPFETNLSAGALSAGIKLDLPAGPGGLTPPLTLAYNSASVSGQHNLQGGAPWVGEGWSLGLGAISWAEHDVNSTCSSCGHQWEDSWQLSDPYGTAADLVPPDINVKTYNDDTPNAFTPSPITWHTAPETRARVISFTTPAPPAGMSPQPPCFRAFLPNGIMEEFGCTPDSLQYYPQPSGVNTGLKYISSWLLDLITDPEGNQIHVTYQQDMEIGAAGISYPRDAVLGTVEWDSPGCKNAQQICAGSAWSPLMRVSFLAGHSIAYAGGTTCPANGNLRCDDPVDLSGSAGLAAPIVQSTFVLNDVQVQVRSSGSAGWNTLRDYRLSYLQGGPVTITDPVSGLQESTAGGLLLTNLQDIGADGSTALPARSFGYSTFWQWYEDSLGAPNPSNNCGPSWNNGITPNGHTGCVLWSQSSWGNSWYLTSASNGLGLTSTFTWQLARNNFHGVVSGSNADPFACNNGSVQSTYPCNMPDDESWSRVVLTQRQDSVVRLSQNGQGGAQTSTTITSTWNYSYQVPTPLLAQECSTCVASFYWGNQNDFDLLDFYNVKFMGFAQTNVQLPDNSVEVHKFHSTEGFGLYDTSRPELVCNTHNPCHDDPYSDLSNAAHGHEYELDRYDTNGTSLLQQVKTRWAASCPPPGVNGTPYNSNYGNWDGNLVTQLDHSNPVMVCEVHPVQVDRYTYDGTGGQPVHSATAFTYDSLGRVASQAQVANTGSTSAADSSGHGYAATLSGGVTEQVLGLVSGDGDPATSFDGTSGYVSAPSLTPLQGGNTRTVELWLQTTSTKQQVVFNSGNQGAGNQAFNIVLTARNGVGSSPPVNTPGLEVQGWNNDVYLPGLSLADGRPHQIVVTLSGTTLNVYVDGTTPQGMVWNGASWSALGNQPISLGSVPNTYAGQVQIGAMVTGGVTSFFQGTLDEVAVYDHVLTLARVQAHLGAGSGYRGAVLADTPTAYYRLDDGAGGPGPNTIVSRPAYIQNDGVNAGQWSATGPYLIDIPAFSDLEDTSGNRYQCSYSSYDGQAFQLGQSSGLTLGKVTTADRYTGCGSAPSFTPSGQVRTTHAFDLFGNPVASSDADANAGNSAHLGCQVGSTTYSSCTTYDSTFGALPVSSANALNQVSSTGYAPPGAAVVADSSGHGQHAAWSGGVTFGVPGAMSGDTAMSFDGTSGYASAPSSATLNLAGPLTLEGWINRSNQSTGPIAEYNNGSAIGVRLWNWPSWDALHVNFTDTSGVDHVVQTGAGQLLSGVWYHVVATYDGSVGRLYLNGSLVASQTLGSFTPQTSYPLYMARRPSGSPNTYFGGLLDEVAVYRGALSAARVQAHYTAGANYRSAVLADSPAAYYRMEDAGNTVADSSGRGNQGTWNGAVILRVPGAVSGDTAMSFDGSSGYATAPSSATLNVAGPLTLEAWINKSNQSIGPIAEYNNGSAIGVRLWNWPSWDALHVNFTDTSGVDHVVQTGGGQLLTGVWYHVVATYDGSVGRLYLNGSLVASQTLGSFTPQTSYPLYMARRPSGSPNTYFGGSLDEVAVYRGALSVARVQAHYTAGANYQSAVLADSPVAYYRMDDGGSGASDGFGLWPLSTTDANGQTTTTGYDPLGRVTSKSLPGETSGLTTLSTSYTVWCSGTAAQSPCVEVDKTQRLNATTTATYRAFYDGLGHLVETRSPAPGGQDVVRNSFYDPSQRLVFQSVPYLVSAYTGGPGSAAYSIPDSTVAGTTSDYDGLGRLTSSTDALSFQSRKSYSVLCSPAGTGDAGCYEQTLGIDAKGHQGGTLVDGLGRTAYVQRYTGNSSSNYGLYATAKYTYDYAGELIGIVQPDGSTQATFSYDMAGRKTAMSDPDLGAQTYSYDQDGNILSSSDARGAAGTVFMGYDGLNRPIWRNTTNSPTGAYDTYGYDATAGGNAGIGRLTSETFSAGSLSGSYAYTYDGRGLQTASTLTVGGSSYPLGSSYDDAGNVLTQTYPDGETITNSYTAQGWLSGVTTSQGSTTLASSLAYTGTGGAFGELTAMHLGGGYDYSASYDLLDRATDLKTKRTSDGTVMFDQSRTFDGAGNVTTAQTTMPGATDNQSFCYDEQDRLTWASAATATPPCGGSNTAGTLTAAQYMQTFSYDVLGRLTSGPLGSYSYSDPAHVHAATGIGTTWTAAYDAVGNMTCRAPTSGSTCAGTQTGAQLGYNNEDELASWQNAPTSPSTTVQFLYDGQGQRVEQSVTQSGTTTTMVYVGNVEEVSTTSGTTTTTAYYYAGGKRIALSVNGVVSYLASDGLGSATVTLNGSGSATAAQLFAPYGAVRYSTGTMPTTYGFTGQRSDAATGLSYYGARYYDPVAGQFTSADSVVPGGGYDLWGLSRYAYVQGNPENRTDPNGHCFCDVPGTGDNFFPQSGGRLLDGNTGDVYIGPSPTPAYHLASWSARPHNYQPYRPYRAPTPSPTPHPAPSYSEAKNPPPQRPAAPAPIGNPFSGLWGAISGIFASPVEGVCACDMTVDDIIADPNSLKGKSPGEVRSSIGKLPPGWREETLGRGEHKGQGWMLRQYSEKGTATGRYIRWHPGGGHHGSDPYWTVSDGTTKTSEIPGGANDLIAGRIIEEPIDPIP